MPLLYYSKLNCEEMSLALKCGDDCVKICSLEGRPQEVLLPSFFWRNKREQHVHELTAVTRQRAANATARGLVPRSEGGPVHNQVTHVLQGQTSPEIP